MASLCRPLTELRKPIQELGDIFDSTGGWGLERAFDKWVHKQEFRKILPRIFQFKVPNATGK